LACLAVLAVFAFIQFSRSGLARRTFEFSSFDGNPVVEDRMLRKGLSREQDIRYYIEELILGPVSVDFAPLITKGTKLASFMYRDRTVYADFSSGAILPVRGGRPLFDSFLAVNRGIRRNFHDVKDVKLFIEGREAFFDEFQKIFGAD
jgi:hypothetical protein